MAAGNSGARVASGWQCERWRLVGIPYSWMWWDAQHMLLVLPGATHEQAQGSGLKSAASLAQEGPHPPHTSTPSHHSTPPPAHTQNTTTSTQAHVDAAGERQGGDGCGIGKGADPGRRVQAQGQRQLAPHVRCLQRTCRAGTRQHSVPGPPAGPRLLDQPCGKPLGRGADPSREARGNC